MDVRCLGAASLSLPPAVPWSSSFSPTSAPQCVPLLTARAAAAATGLAEATPCPQAPEKGERGPEPAADEWQRRDQPGGSSYRRSMTGPGRSVEILGDQMVAFGRPILTGVPAGVTAGPCKDHDGPNAAQTQGTFLGTTFSDASSRTLFSLGTLRGLRFLSCFRFKLWWMTQRVGTSGREVPHETQFLLLECPPLPRDASSAGAAEPAGTKGQAAGGSRERRSNQSVRSTDTVYVVLLPVLEGAFRSSLQGGDGDQLEVCVESGSPAVTTSEALEAVYAHAGWNPFRTISEAVRAVEAHSGSFTRRERKTMPELLDHFGWCTWDAFYTNVTAQGVNQGLESLAQGGTPARFLIIDDGWQSVTENASGYMGSQGVVTAGTQYASRLTCVKESQKFKSSSSLKAQASAAEALREAQLAAGAGPGAGSGPGAGGGPGAGSGPGAGAGPGAGSGPGASAPNGVGTEEAQEKPARAADGIEAQDASTPSVSTALPSSLLPPLAPASAAAVAAADAATAAALVAEESRLAGLGELVQQVKATHSFRFVYVWHALLGYWGGVNPGPEGGMDRFKAMLTYPVPSSGVLTNQPDMAEDTLTVNGLGVVDPEKAFHFYDELHSYLASCGVDGVKVDVQNILETLGAGHGGRVALARLYHSALESSIRKNFRDNGIISCMSHNTDALYLAKQTAVMRASDDFWPTDPASHTVHIISVAYNSLFLGEFMQPDWDMFQSQHPAAQFHGAARAAGGCAVYVSDKPGVHDVGVLRKLVLQDGSILRARLPGRPTRDCLFVDPARDATSLLKIWNMNACAGIVAAFNCQGAAWCREGRKYTVHNPVPGTVTGVVSADDVDALEEVAPPEWAGDVVVYSHFADELVTLPPNTNLVVSLAPLQCEVFTMAPIKVLGAGLEFAPIGFGRMYNAGGAVLDTRYALASPTPPSTPAAAPAAEAAANGVGHGQTGAEGEAARATLIVRGGADCMAYASKEPSRVVVNDKPCAFEYSAVDGRITVPLTAGPSSSQLDIYF